MELIRILKEMEPHAYFRWGVTYKKKEKRIHSSESNKRIEPSLVKVGLITLEKKLTYSNHIPQ